MTDMERVWQFGRIIRQICDVGQEIKERLTRYEHHCIRLVPPKKQEAGKGGKET